MFKFDTGLLTNQVDFLFQAANYLHSLSECFLYLCINSCWGVSEDFQFWDVSIFCILNLVDSNGRRIICGFNVLEVLGSRCWLTEDRVWSQWSWTFHLANLTRLACLGLLNMWHLLVDSCNTLFNCFQSMHDLDLIWILTILESHLDWLFVFSGRAWRRFVSLYRCCILIGLFSHYWNIRLLYQIDILLTCPLSNCFSFTAYTIAVLSQLSECSRCCFLVSIEVFW